MVVGGYGQLTDAMASHVQQLRYSAPVEEVAVREGGGIVVSTREGSRFEADIVIVSVPVGVLHSGTIRFRPGMPAWKKQALARIGMGKLSKVLRCSWHSMLCLW
jgi:polyamine oxidase